MAINAAEYSTNCKFALLFGSLGLAAQRIFQSLPPIPPPAGHSGAGQWNKYTEAIARLKQFSDPPNIMLERHKFYKRIQKEEENVEEYISAQGFGHYL